jgi:hypothetical protein
MNRKDSGRFQAQQMKAALQAPVAKPRMALESAASSRHVFQDNTIK